MHVPYDALTCSDYCTITQIHRRTGTGKSRRGWTLHVGGTSVDRGPRIVESQQGCSPHPHTMRPSTGTILHFICVTIRHTEKITVVVVPQ